MKYFTVVINYELIAVDSGAPFYPETARFVTTEVLFPSLQCLSFN